ncbi:MAG TPA: hypothetical protein VIV61_02950 [Candidatus Ozemobacteraceae bacterium]
MRDMIVKNIYGGSGGRSDKRRSALAEAISAWWASPTDHTWRMLQPPLYDVIVRVAVPWARKHGLGDDSRLTPADLAQDSFSRFLEEFQDGVESVPDLAESGRESRYLTKQALADMQVTFSAEQVVSYLQRRAEYHFKNQFDRQRRTDRRMISMVQVDEDGEWQQMEIEDRTAPDPTSLTVATAAEDREAERHLKSIWASSPKKKQIQAYLLQQSLRHADVMAARGVPKSVFRHLNACEQMENKRVIRVGTRNEMSGSSDAIQATILGRFLNLGRSTALEQVKAFDRYLIDRVKPACDAGRLDFLTVVGCLLRKAVSRLVSERAPFWCEDPLPPVPGKRGMKS